MYGMDSTEDCCQVIPQALHIPSCVIKSCHQGNSKIMILFFNKWTRVYSSLIGTLVNNTMLQAMDKKDNALVPLVPPENKSRREELLEFFEETCVQAVAKCSGIIISHPFYVISVRMMVQFVGQETIYSGLCASVKEIYNNEGLGGFFRTTSSIECELLEVRNSREEKETGQLLTWVKNRMKAKIWKSRDTREENEDGGKHPIRVGR
nr:mitochondrial carrier homolog 2-like isoform X8 [Pocillopora verrucosa]